MKKALCLLLALGIALGAGGCGRISVESGSGELEIAATVFPAYDFARCIGGERVHVTLLVPPGAEAHSFEPTPQDLLRIESCGLIFCNGGESEAWLESLLAGMEDAPVLAMMDCVEALEEETREGMQLTHDEQEGDETEYDEHVWTSPRNAELICRELCRRLCLADPEGEEYYTERLEAYIEQLQALDREFRDIAQSAQSPVLIFADRFPVRYFTEEYGFEYYAAFPGCADEAEPSAKTVAFLIDRVREQQVRAVFYIEFSNQKMADVICEDTGCRKLLFNSCHNVSTAELLEGVSYTELMWDNARTLREALC